MKWVLRLYPQRWLERYGAELEAFLDATPFTPRLLLDLLKGAIDASLHPDLAVRRFALTPPAWMFVPNVGFRSSGIQLEHPLTLVQGDRTLRISHLVCTAAGIDLRFDITEAEATAEHTDARSSLNMTPELAMSLARETTHMISFRIGDREHRVEPGPGDTQRIPGGLSRSFVLRPPLPLDLTHVELRIASAYLGNWNVPVALVPFSASDAVQGRRVQASESHEGIAVAVHGVAVGPDFTAIDLSMSAPADSECAGIGGIHGMRGGPTALLLRDQSGRTYAEIPQPRGMHAASSASGDAAFFEPIAAGASELELVVPFVYLVHREARVDVELPVTSPAKVMLGDFPITVLASATVPEKPDAPRGHREPALGLDLDLGSWHGDRRVLVPRYVAVDDQTRGARFPKPFNVRAPEPVNRIEVAMDNAQDARTLMLSAPTVQIRGPWLIRFGRGPAT